MTTLALYSYAKVQSIEISAKEDTITLRAFPKSNLFNSLDESHEYTFQTNINGKTFTFEAIPNDQGANITKRLENDDAAAIAKILDPDNDNDISNKEFKQEKMPWCHMRKILSCVKIILWTPM